MLPPPPPPRPPFFPVGGGIPEGIIDRLGPMVGPLSPFGLAGIGFLRGREPPIPDPRLAPMFSTVVGRTASYPPLDIIFIMDGSMYTRIEDSSGGFAWNPEILTFMRNIIGQLPMERLPIRLGVIVYSTGVDDILPLTPERAFLQDAIFGLRPRFGSINAGSGIAAALAMFQQYSRPGAIRRALLFISGPPTDAFSARAEADRARSMGIDFMVIGYGNVGRRDMTHFGTTSQWLVPGGAMMLNQVTPSIFQRITAVPVNGGWSGWSVMSGCSASCGSGVQFRFRVCDNPNPANGGAGCTGSNRETTPCMAAQCAAPGNQGCYWVNWSTWNACSVPCGVGMTSRTRTCMSAFGQSCNACTGESIERQSCVVSACAVNGGWSQWSEWGQCSSSCGTSTRLRVRQCTSPAPSNGGELCQGYSIDESLCQTGVPCPVNGGWSFWSDWFTCSVTCGIGVQSRRRQCNRPLPEFGGVQCIGDMIEESQCDTKVPCPIDGGWGSWSDITPCSVTCEQGVKRRVRSCDNPSPLNGGLQCAGEGIEENICDTGVRCPVHGGWMSWSEWSLCTVSCGNGGTTRRIRQCSDSDPIQADLFCTGPSFEEMICNSGIACPVNGNWAQWNLWSRCSVDCGSGVRHRSRTCNNPEPLYGGLMCQGSFEEEDICNTGILCPIDGGWSPWSEYGPCSNHCGIGLMVRQRECNNPLPMNGGSPCTGKSQEERMCDTGIPCPVHGGWGLWTPFSACSVSCGIGRRERSRECNNPVPMFGGHFCTEISVETDTCDTGISCPINGHWSSWSEFLPCSAKCGSGTKKRVRECFSPKFGGNTCNGLDTEELICDSGIPCPVDGGWTLWSDWEICLVPCGTGITRRFRECSNPMPMYGGIPCQGFSVDEKKCDSGIMCPIHGGWSQWSDWTKCSSECGMGTSQRIRACDSPASMYGGKPCSGDLVEITECDSGKPCPINGGWAQWEAWSTCAGVCGQEERFRKRQCTIPIPLFGGLPCQGPDTEIQPCKTGVLCPIDGNWAPWLEWGKCSVLCGAGIRTRFRTCTNPEPINGGRICEGNEKEVFSCDTGIACSVDGQWSHWSSWSVCSASCGAGLETRNRLCDNPATVNGGRDCEGFNEESRICNTYLACPINGNWAQWSGWTQCSVTCGVGIKVRKRECSNPFPENGGKLCIGDDTESMKCDSGVPCLDPNQLSHHWTEWSRWSKCPVSCGVGEQKRTRTCLHNGLPSESRLCGGQREQVHTCIMSPCPDPPISCEAECKWVNGIGYARYPGDCSKFVQCDSINGIPQIHRCPWNTLWSQNMLQCVHPEQSECLVCPDKSYAGHVQYDISCKAYFECHNGRALSQCCATGSRYEISKGCVPDDLAVCTDPCRPAEVLGHAECHFRDSRKGEEWYDEMINGDWISRPCGIGTYYSPKECICVYKHGGNEIKVCKPDLYLPFNSMLEDLSLNKGIQIEGVKYLGDGTAHFNGQSFVLSNIFANAEWGGDVHIYVRFKAEGDGGMQTLVHNSGCGKEDLGPSVFIGLDRGQGYGKDLNVKFSAVPTGSINYSFINMTIPDHTFEEAWFRFSNGDFVATISSEKGYVEAKSGNIARRHGALNIGGNLCRIGNDAFNGFIGILDEVKIYRCRPPGL
ncbi:hypothetical protein ACJMK2_032566 [Sinanodonta woodiana]|uniref:Hemicentin-1 n=1 Tax=Sinanodonta woodiana TaxID=1069815 RepID=A0ABD3X677_SINWO